MQTYVRLPVAFVRGEGSRLWDSSGREYLDFLSGLAVTSLGHAHPEVAAAIGDQAATLLHVSNLYYNDLQPRLAERLDLLVTSATGTPGRVFFTNSGAEANECAIKLSRRHGQQHGGPERFHVLSAYNSSTAAPSRPWPRPASPRSRRRSSRSRRASARWSSPISTRCGGDGRARLRGPARGGPGEGGVQPAPPGLPRSRPPPVRRARSVARSSTRSRPVSAGPGAGSASSTVATFAPTSSRWRRPSATVFRSGPVGRGAGRSPPPSGPEITPRPSAVSLGRTPAVSAVLDVMEREGCRNEPRKQGSDSRKHCSPFRRSATCAAPIPLAVEPTPPK